MNSNTCGLLAVLALILSISGTAVIAAEPDPLAVVAETESPPSTVETDTPPEVVIPDRIYQYTTDPYDIDETDEIGETYLFEAGKAKDAFKEKNPCEGRLSGKYLGSEVCDECHQDKIETLLAHPHGRVTDSRTPFGQYFCETCHGPGELHFKTEGNCIVSMSGRYSEPVEQRNDVCMGCHKGGSRMHWLSSSHETEGLACVSCHSIHQTDKVIKRNTQTEVCFSCHKDIRAQTFRASSHPIQENKVICSDCHGAHGSAGPSSLKQPTINENCYNCHAEKRGPFLWEHYPVSEDCTLCHRVHGSNHQALLNKPGPQLCQQCHAVSFSGGGRTHINNLLDFDNTDQARARSIIGMNCANCHNKVHGSNHPSGSVLQR